MGSCSPNSFVSNFSPSLEPLKSSGSSNSFSLNFSNLDSFKSSASVPSWKDTLKNIVELNLPSLSDNKYLSLKGSVTPKSLDYIDFNSVPKFEFPKPEPVNSWKSSSSPKSLDYMNLKTFKFDLPKPEPVNSWKSSSSLSSWQDTLNKINEIKLPVLNSLKSSSSPKSLDYIDFNSVPKFEFPKPEPVKTWEIPVPSSTLFNFSHTKEPTIGSLEWFKEKNSFINPNGDEENYKSFEIPKPKPLNIKGGLYFREIPSLNDQLHVHPSSGFAKLKKSGRYLSNYQAAMLDLLGESENGKSGGDNW